MDEVGIEVRAQVAAYFTKSPVIYEWPDNEAPKVARPRPAARGPYEPYRMDLGGPHEDRLVGALKRSMLEREIEYSEAFMDGVYQVTVWWAVSPGKQSSCSSAALDHALTGALAGLVGAA